MKITDEMVARAEREYWDMTEDPEGARDMRAVLSNFAAALAVQTQQGVEVKKLEWFKSQMPGWDGDYHTVPTAYTVRCADENGWKWAGFGGFGYSSSPSAAKAAAQSDYETRIRSAICGGDGDVPAAESEPVAWLRVAKMTPITGDDYKSLWLTNEEDPRGFPVYAHPPRSLSNEGWMPIETAPKDWTNIILFDAERDPEVFEGYFSMDDGGRNCWMENQGMGSEPVNPTLWMPLPAAPIASGASTHGGKNGG